MCAQVAHTRVAQKKGGAGGNMIFVESRGKSSQEGKNTKKTYLGQEKEEFDSSPFDHVLCVKGYLLVVPANGQSLDTLHAGSLACQTRDVRSLLRPQLMYHGGLICWASTPSPCILRSR